MQTWGICYSVRTDWYRLLAYPQMFIFYLLLPVASRNHSLEPQRPTTKVGGKVLGDRLELPCLFPWAKAFAQHIHFNLGRLPPPPLFPAYLFSWRAATALISAYSSWGNIKPYWFETQDQLQVGHSAYSEDGQFNVFQAEELWQLQSGGSDAVLQPSFLICLPSKGWTTSSWQEAVIFLLLISANIGAPNTSSLVIHALKTIFMVPSCPQDTSKSHSGSK